MVKIHNDKKKTSMRSSLKAEAPVLREALDQLPLYQRLLFPFVVVGGVIWELSFAAKLHKEEKKLIASINDKYDIEEVKLHVQGCCSTNPRSVDYTQMCVMKVNGVDYAFVIIIDGETGEPTLYPAPYIDDSMPYQPCPINPIDLLKNSEA